MMVKKNALKNLIKQDKDCHGKTKRAKLNAYSQIFIEKTADQISHFTEVAFVCLYILYIDNRGFFMSFRHKYRVLFHM